MNSQSEKTVPNISISSKYVPILAEFMAKNDSRYYLNGFHVEPHHQTGVLLVATDGHAMTIIHDVNGCANGSFIFELPSAVISACKRRSRLIHKSPKVLRIIDEAAYVLADDEIDPLKIGKLHLAISHIKEIEGKFPDWRKAVPRKLDKSSLIEVNANLLNKVRIAAKTEGGYSPITVFMNGRTGAIVIRPSAVPEMIVICMPMRIDDVEIIKQPIPGWLVLPEPEQKAA